MIGQSTAELAAARSRYEKLYLRYRSYGRDARRLVELADEGSTDEMVRLWKSIDPIAVNEAFAFVKGELEWTDKIRVGEGPIPRGAKGRGRPTDASSDRGGCFVEVETKG